MCYDDREEYYDKRAFDLEQSQEEYVVRGFKRARRIKREGETVVQRSSSVMVTPLDLQAYQTLYPKFRARPFFSSGTHTHAQNHRPPTSHRSHALHTHKMSKFPISDFLHKRVSSVPIVPAAVIFCHQLAPCVTTHRLTLERLHSSPKFWCPSISVAIRRD